MEFSLLPEGSVLSGTLAEAVQILAVLLFPLIMIRIIGGVYYLTRLLVPPMVSFQQATSKFWVVASSIVLWIVVVLSQTVMRLSGQL